MSRAASEWLRRVWYGRSAWSHALLPLGWSFAAAAGLRRYLYRTGTRRSVDVGVPVVVVGNITTGGTGKTPVTMWLAAALRDRGLRPGIVSRGYGGRAGKVPLRVSRESDAGMAGDEPLLMARRDICPVVVHPDRVAAAEVLARSGCNVVIADDGLQHYRLRRYFEVAVIDGDRGFGNGRRLPAGPLREDVSRLAAVDRVMLQEGREAESLAAWLRNLRSAESTRFELAVSGVHDLQGTRRQPLDAFRGKAVHAVAAIGHPERFFHLLESHGIGVRPHAFPDHARLSHADLDFGDDLDVLMTEKDAVKLGPPAPSGMPCNWWYVAVDLKLRDATAPDWVDGLAERVKTGAARNQ